MKANCSNPCCALTLTPRRLLAMERLSGGRVTSANNAFSAVRCAFRFLFGRCLQPGELTQARALAACCFKLPPSQCCELSRWLVA
jgi:hypothetical protein